jgi:hypothetical protein
MPTNPRPTSLFEIVKRAVEVADPDDADGRLGDFLLQFEDDDEPVAGVLDELERLVAEAAAFVDPEIEDPAVSMAVATTLYLARHRDELHAEPDKILRLAARAEWQGDPPGRVVEWLADRGVTL